MNIILNHPTLKGTPPNEGNMRIATVKNKKEIFADTYAVCRTFPSIWRGGRWPGWFSSANRAITRAQFIASKAAKASGIWWGNCTEFIKQRDAIAQQHAHYKPLEQK